MILNILKATRASRANEGKSMKASQIDRIRIAQYIFSIYNIYNEHQLQVKIGKAAAILPCLFLHILLLLLLPFTCQTLAEGWPQRGSLQG